MDTIISIATFATLFLSFLAGLITYKRIEKPKNRKTIAFIVSFITFFLMAFLSISDLPDYVNIIYKGKDSIDVVGLYFLLIITAIYIEMILITDDLIKNIDILISIFKK